MTLEEVFATDAKLRSCARHCWARWYCIHYDYQHGEAPPITALLCCGIGTAYARDIRNDLIRRGVIRPRTSCVRAWEAMRKVQP